MSIARLKNSAFARKALSRKLLRSLGRWKLIAHTFYSDESGQDLIEYALVAGLVGLGCIAAMQGLTNSIAAVMSKLGRTLMNAT